MIEPLNKWKFLLGNWESDPRTHIGDKPNTINQATITNEPSNKYYQINNRTITDGEETARSIAYLFYDTNTNNWYQKAIYGFGFVVNYIEHKTLKNKIIYHSATIDANPENFQENQFKFILHKLNKARFKISLNIGEDFEEMNTF